ncbi:MULTISPECIES: hypothetical protein [Bacillota]|uniref:hypothetical protein n=1 Tax=Bacillota TaxID=1239 RepID=UPI0039F0A86F
MNNKEFIDFLHSLEKKELTELTIYLTGYYEKQGFKEVALDFLSRTKDIEERTMKK